MPNIFEEKNEENLVQNREVRPIKGNKPEPQPQQQPEPQPQETPVQNEQVQEMPLMFRDGFNPAPVVPPSGHGQLNGVTLAGSKTSDLLQREVQARQTQDSSMLDQFLQENVYREPVSTNVSPEIQSHIDSAADFSASQEAWKKYVIPNKVGISSGTTFSEDGSVVKSVPQAEVERSVNGLQSRLGRQLEERFDKDGFWNRNLKRAGGFFEYGKNALEYARNKYLTDVPNVAKLATGAVNPFVNLLSGIDLPSPEEIEEVEREFVGKTLPDLNGSERSLGYELQPYDSPEFGEYGRAGVLSLGAYLLNLPENIVSAGVYEFADTYREHLRQNQEIKSPILRTTMNALSPLTSGGEALLNLTVGTAIEGMKEVVQGSTDEGDNRLVQVLKGKNVSLANRWTERDYLGVQEPETLPVGQLSGNWYWDLPENIHDNLLKLGIKSDLRGLHWATQGVLATALELGLDAPIDMGIDSIKQSVKALNAADLFNDTGRVVSKNLEAAPKLPELPAGKQGGELATTVAEEKEIVEVVQGEFVTSYPELPSGVPLVRGVNTESIVPYEVKGLLEDSAEVTPSLNVVRITSPDLVDTTSIRVYNKGVEEVSFPVKVSQEDLTPNVNRAQALNVQLDNMHNAKPLYKDIPVVERDIDDLSNLARSLVDENGKALVPNKQLTEAELSVLIDVYPDEFVTYGKHINPLVPHANTVELEYAVPKTGLREPNLDVPFSPDVEGNQIKFRGGNLNVPTEAVGRVYKGHPTVAKNPDYSKEKVSEVLTPIVTRVKENIKGVDPSVVDRVKLPKPVADYFSSEVSKHLPFRLRLLEGYRLGELEGRAETILQGSEAVKKLLDANGATELVEAHGLQKFGGVWSNEFRNKPWQSIIDEMYPEGTRVMVCSCSSEAFGKANPLMFDTWQVVTSGSTPSKGIRNLPLVRNTGVKNPNEVPATELPLTEGLNKFQKKVKQGVWSNSELTKLRLQEARLPAEEVYTTLAKLPKELKGKAKETISKGGEYIESLRRLEFLGKNLRETKRYVADLEGMSRSIESKLDTLGKLGRGDINVESTPRQVLGGFMSLPKSKEVEEFTEQVANALALRDVAGMPVTKYQVFEGVPTKNHLWMHGTRYTTDIRGYLPENGSGAHELGIGVYFTQNEELAKAHALAFGHSNVPTSFEDSIGEPSIRYMDTRNIRNVLSLNDVPSKKQFTSLFKDPFMEATGADSGALFTDFWKYHKANGGRYADTYDNFRVWHFEKYGDVSEELVRNFQVGAFGKLKSEGIEAGVYEGATGEKLLVVYQPEKLVNFDNAPVAKPDIDPTAAALEARRYADTHTHSVKPSKVTEYNRLESTQEVAEYTKQVYTEGLAKQYLEQADELDNSIKLSQELEESVRLENARVEEMFDSKEAVETVLGAESSEVTSQVSDILQNSETYRTYRNQYEKELRDLDKKLSKPKLSQVKRAELIEQRKALVMKATEVEERVEHLRKILHSLHPDEPKGGKVDEVLGGLKSILKSHRVQTLNPKWYTRSGAYARRSSIERLRERFVRWASENLDASLGGDWGKVQADLARMKRLGQGELSHQLAVMEADQKIAQVMDVVEPQLRKYGLKQDEIYEVVTNLAELQASPYILEATLKANTNTGKYLASLLNSKFLKYSEAYNIPKSVLEDVAMEVRKIPAVYEEVKHIMESVGLSVGDEVTLGYMPRIKTRSAEYAISTREGRISAGSANKALSKSRKAFDYVVEDSMLLDEFLKIKHPSFFSEVSEMVGREVTTVEDIIGEDNLLEYAVVGKLTGNQIDLLNEMGILNKVPFTSDKVAEFLVGKYELPFKGLNDIFIQDPKRAFQMYKTSLEELAAKSGMVYSIGNAEPWTVTDEFIQTLSKEDQSIYEGWVKISDSVSESVSSKLDEKTWESMKDLKVHPIVSDLLEAQINLQTDPFNMGVVGNIVSSLTRYLQGSVLATVQFGVNSVFGNAGALLVRGISPTLYSQYTQLALRGLDKTLPNTVKAYAGGKYTAKELYLQAVKYGLIDTATAFGGRKPLVNARQWASTANRSMVEFIDFAKNSNSDLLSGMVERFLEGVATTQDHSMFAYIQIVSQITDNAYKLSLLDAVTADQFKPLQRASRYFGELPHYTDIDEAIEWVERNAYLFDDVSKNENIGRLLIPYWTWQRKAFFNNVKFVADHPARFGSYLKIVNGIRNDFEEDDPAAYDALQMSGFMSGKSMIPLKIDKSYSASGEDEYYVFPLGQIVPLADFPDTLEALGNMFGYEESIDPVHMNEANKFSGNRDTLKQWIIESGSPVVQGVMGVIDPEYIYPSGSSVGSVADEVRDDYPYGLNKHSYQLLKMYGKPMYTLWKMLPESVVGRGASLNPRTGEWDEGRPSVFTGEVPKSTRFNKKAPFGREGFGGMVSAFLDLAGKNPYHLDVLLSQDMTVGQIKSQMGEIKNEIGRLKGRLSNTTFENKDQQQRIFDQYEQLKLTYIFLQAEVDIYSEWRKANNLPTTDALGKIRKQNIKVDRMLPEEERRRIYQENFERWYDKL